jgi:DNA invertase Pin-like site-specific DNA recombinase
MAIIGYARVSSKDQDLTIQLDALKAAGCTKIFSEKHTGTTTNRPEFEKCLEFIREGDVLAVTRIDRLGRNTSEMCALVDKLQQDGIQFRAIEQSIDTTNSMGKCFLQMMFVFAELETNLRKERQRGGIDAAKAKGDVYKGRVPTAQAKAAQVVDLAVKGMTRQAIADELGIGVASVYNILRDAKAQCK